MKTNHDDKIRKEESTTDKDNKLRFDELSSKGIINLTEKEHKEIRKLNKQESTTDKCECCQKRKTLNQFKWLDNKTYLCYSCADRIGKNNIWKTKGMKEGIRLLRISFNLETALGMVLNNKEFGK